MEHLQLKLHNSKQKEKPTIALLVNGGPYVPDGCGTV